MWIDGPRAHLLANPGIILVLGTGIDHQQVVVVAEAVHENVVDECALGREQSGVVRLPILEARRIVHGDVLDSRERARPAKLDLAHVAHVEQAHAGAHGKVLGNQAAAWTRVLDRHIPSAKVHHFGFERAMRGVECGLPELWGNERGWSWLVLLGG